jgi:pimeloyl-ACP methyl ester carboxylesterase
LADDTHEFLKSINALPCVLGGLSMGGYISLPFAKKYQSDLLGLMLIDSRAGVDTPAGKAGRNEMIQIAKTHGSIGVAKQMLPKMFAPGVDSKLSDELMRVMTACPVPTIINATEAMRDREDFTDWLKRITVPTLIIVGESDVLATPEMAKAVHEAIGGSILETIKNAGHMTIMEQPQTTAQAITRFLAGITHSR